MTLADDVVVHTIGRQIEFAGPRYRTHLDRRLSEQTRISQMSKNAPKETRLKTEPALDAVAEADTHRAIAIQRHIDDAPRRSIPKRRRHGSGAIFTG